MYQLTYYSKAVKNISTSDIRDILNVSVKNNQAEHLTGCLLLIENTFIQILEGDQLKIENIYKKLLLDQGHKNVTLISKGISDLRFFQEWGMAYYPVSDNKKIVLNLNDFNAILIHYLIYHNLVQTLKDNFGLR